MMGQSDIGATPFQSAVRAPHVTPRCRAKGAPKPPFDMLGNVLFMFLGDLYLRLVKVEGEGTFLYRRLITSALSKSSFDVIQHLETTTAGCRLLINGRRLATDRRLRSWAFMLQKQR